MTSNTLFLNPSRWLFKKELEAFLAVINIKHEMTLVNYLSRFVVKTAISLNRITLKPLQNVCSVHGQNFRYLYGGYVLYLCGDSLRAMILTPISMFHVRL